MFIIMNGTKGYSDAVKLTDSVSIPVLGLGTWTLKGNLGQQTVENALNIGYRHIDTADIYSNHKIIGKAIIKSLLKRKDIFITTKIPPSKLVSGDILDMVDKYCNELSVDYLDLLLIHWPFPLLDYDGIFEGFEKARSKGLIRAYGVSNFKINTLRKLLTEGKNIIVDQIEFHPTDNHKELADFCIKNDIAVTAYSPLGRGGDLKLDAVRKLAQKYHKTASQIILNWELSKGFIVIPRASSNKHLRDNFESNSFKMKQNDLALLDNISR